VCVRGRGVRKFSDAGNLALRVVFRIMKV